MKLNLMVFIQDIIYLKKNMAYLVNLDESKSIGTHWIALYLNGNNESVFYDATYFNSFGVEHIPKEIKKIHRKQRYHKKYL